MHARAYLWFGTKLVPGSPVALSETELLHRLPSHTKLVRIRGIASAGYWALAITGTYHHHNWTDNGIVRSFDLLHPWPEQREKLLQVCGDLGWPCDARELGWYQGAAYW